MGQEEGRAVTAKQFFKAQMLPAWNHPPRTHYSLDWVHVRRIERRVSIVDRRARKLARVSKCEECGKDFSMGERKRAQTCSKACHVAAMKKGGRTYAKLQAACAPCLYRVGLGVQRIANLTRIAASRASNAIKRAGITINHAEKCSVSARISNRKRGERSRPSREAKARLRADLRLLRQVIGEIRSELRAKAKTDPKEIERTRNAARSYYRNNARKVLDKSAEKFRNNPAYRMRQRLRHRMWFLVTTAGQKKRRSNVLVGCSDLHLKQWLQAKFKRGMTWDNYGQWEVDHILPCASFDLSNKEDQDKCFHYTNLQPLWKRENRMKHDTMPTNHQPELAMPYHPTRQL